MSMGGETKFKMRVLWDLRKLPDAYLLKTQERARRGVLDLIICLKGKFVSIELKIDGEKPTKLQQIGIERIRKAGGISFYTTPAEWPSHYEMLKGL